MEVTKEILNVRINGTFRGQQLTYLNFLMYF